jgi:hypothetical protein
MPVAAIAHAPAAKNIDRRSRFISVSPWWFVTATGTASHRSVLGVRDAQTLLLLMLSL